MEDIMYCQVTIVRTKKEVKVEYDFSDGCHNETGTLCEDCKHPLVKSAYDSRYISIDLICNADDNYQDYTHTPSVKGQVVKLILEHIAYEGCTNRLCKNFAISEFGKEGESSDFITRSQDRKEAVRGAFEIYDTKKAVEEFLESTIF